MTKTGPVGIDIALQDLQTHLHTQLLSLWGIDSSAYKCYGRCYRNRSADGYIAENYEGNREYREVYWDDSLKVVSFFGTGPKTERKTLDTTDVHLVFFVNVAAVKSSVSHRADEEVRADVIKLVGSNPYGFEYQSTEVYLENVLREYPGSRRDKRLNAVDMQPVHCFRLNFSTTYDIEQTCKPIHNF